MTREGTVSMKVPAEFIDLCKDRKKKKGILHQQTLLEALAYAKKNKKTWL